MGRFGKAGWLIAVLALVAASAGTATAGKLITGKQIKRGAVAGQHLKRNAVTGRHVRGRSITLSDLAPSARPQAGPRGPQGPAGPAGPAGPPGPAGGTGAVTVVESGPRPYGAYGVESAEATCPAGTRLVGGGHRHAADGQTSIAMSIPWSAPSAANTWGVIVVNNDSEGDELIAVATCAPGGSVPTRSAALRGADGPAAAFAATLRAARAAR